MNIFKRKLLNSVNTELILFNANKIFYSSNAYTVNSLDQNANVKFVTSPDPDPEQEVKVRLKSEMSSEESTLTEPKNISNSKFNEYRENEMKIQMLSKNLYSQIFKGNETEDEAKIKNLSSYQYLVNRYRDNLTQYGMKIDEATRLPDVTLKLPKLKGRNIEEHFYQIASEQCEPYKKLILSIITPEQSMSMPKKWIKKLGWTRYDKITGSAQSVPYPDPNDQALILDVEVCVKAGTGPVIACALGKHYWYSWTSKYLFERTYDTETVTKNQQYKLQDLIPLESIEADTGCEITEHMKLPKIIIGHNVSYDRARIKEQYWLNSTGTRFLDTMSLHVCVSGVTSYQRAMLKSTKTEMIDDDLLWSEQSSLNNLIDVYQLYCGKQLEKTKREVFIEGTMSDINEQFQDLMTYCAGDVQATYEIVCKLFPLFLERFPHPATLAGMFELGMAYLPINSNWKRYIDESNLTYEDLDIETKHLLKRRADQTCRLLHNNAYKEHLWMWDQDWDTKPFKFNKPKVKKKKQNGEIENSNDGASDKKMIIEKDNEVNSMAEHFSYLYSTKERIPKRRSLLPGYPNWYRKLCTKSDEIDWTPGPQDIGTGMQIAPKLLSLCWEGYPLHFVREQGWGFLVPFKYDYSEDETGQIPIRQLVKKCPVIETNTSATQNESAEALSNISKDVESNLSRKDYYRKKKKDKTNGQYTGTGVWCNLPLENCCWFIKLPHKNGETHRVGNPLARDFLNKFSENVLSGEGAIAEKVIEIARMLSYWRNNRDRIVNQMICWFDSENLPIHLRNDSKFNTEMLYGAIIPQVVVCGTLTRRAMEPTWMTASNAQRERIGSELRGMVQAPNGYKIVGADVDSQELWIASILGDASDKKLPVHGCTPFGWMTLSGSKSNGTDMHSVTANAIGISRDHAKVINYARIYGAGQNFAETLLKQFNPTIADGSAKSKAMKMFLMTKGKRLYELLPEYHEEIQGNKWHTSYTALKVAAAYGKRVSEIFYKPKWIGGTESAMFNRLEEIASSEMPCTPFLQGRLSRALEPQITGGNEDRFLTTRVNWVVQSGAVDFLHLMLVSMRWLMGSDIRFCLSFHDEIRYLVHDRNAYKCALAMHITNLLTRSFCAYKVGLPDLPQSVAFFSSVEVDTVLRKEAKLDCKTPSNPYGLSGGYGIPFGESLTIEEAIEKAGGNDVFEETIEK